MDQRSLFEGDEPLPDRLPEGLAYEPNFLAPVEEARLLALIASLPLHAAQYKGYTARRRVLSFGGSFDFDANHLVAAPPLIDALVPLRDRVAAWTGLPCDAFVQGLVAEYPPGAPLGWHRDVPDFEVIAGVSLGGAGVLRLRPYPPVPNRRDGIIRLPVAPRSIYRMQGTARWAWQHSVPPVVERRWSITFRTRISVPSRR